MFSDPKTNIKYLGLDLGMSVADLGAGSGFYSFEAAKLIGKNGKVYAIDIQKDLLEKIKSEAEDQGLNNIEIIWGDVDEEKGTKLVGNSVDRAIVSNIFFQLEKKENFIKELKRILKPKGKALLIEWSDSFSGLGPRKEDIISKEKMKEFVANFGFLIEREISVGDHHYGFILKNTE